MTTDPGTRTTIAIVGAGTGTGAAVARKFGHANFPVALISRDQAKLDQLATGLIDDGITARGFAADVTDAAALRRALSEAGAWGGPIEVLQYSPIPHRDFLKPVLETTSDDLAHAMAFSIYGPKIAVDTVLPGMRALGRGTILFVNGGSAVRPNAAVAGTSIAFAGESAYAQMLNGILGSENIHVAQLIIPGAISTDSPDSSPDAIAERLWQIHVGRDSFRSYQTPL